MSRYSWILFQRGFWLTGTKLFTVELSNTIMFIALYLERPLDWRIVKGMRTLLLFFCNVSSSYHTYHKSFSCVCYRLYSVHYGRGLAPSRRLHLFHIISHGRPTQQQSSFSSPTSPPPTTTTTTSPPRPSSSSWLSKRHEKMGNYGGNVALLPSGPLMLERNLSFPIASLGSMEIGNG